MEYDFKIKTQTTGFSSPAENYVCKRLDPSDLLIKNPYSTFFLRASGDKYDIKDQDILVVDKSISPNNESIIIIEKEGRLEIEKFHNNLNHEIWGVVTFIIKKV